MPVKNMIYVNNIVHLVHLCSFYNYARKVTSCECVVFKTAYIIEWIVYNILIVASHNICGAFAYDANWLSSYLLEFVIT